MRKLIVIPFIVIGILGYIFDRMHTALEILLLAICIVILKIFIQESEGYQEPGDVGGCLIFFVGFFVFGLLLYNLPFVLTELGFK